MSVPYQVTFTRTNDLRLPSGIFGFTPGQFLQNRFDTEPSPSTVLVSDDLKFIFERTFRVTSRLCHLRITTLVLETYLDRSSEPRQ